MKGGDMTFDEFIQSHVGKHLSPEQENLLGIFLLDDVIQVEDQDSLQRRIADFLSTRNTVVIDGEAVKPIIDKIHFVEINSFGIQVVIESRPLNYSSVIIGVIFAFL